MKTLIADDSALVRGNLRRLLAAACKDIEIVEADDVAATIRQLEEEKPDALLLDLRMPGGSGFEVLEYLRENRSDTVTIVLTNYATESNREKSLSYGVHHFFDKSREYGEAIDLLKSVADQEAV